VSAAASGAGDAPLDGAGDAPADGAGDAPADGAGDAPADGPARPTWILPALAALALLRLAWWLLAPPNSDEAYYWLWGRHPALSYLDHPPLHAWLQGLAHAALGTSHFALRLTPALTSVATGWVAWRLARRLAPAGRGNGPAALLAFFGSPLLLMLTGFAWQDHLLILGWLVAAWLALEFLHEVLEGGRGRTALLLGAGLALGLAGLAKYSAVLLGVALLAVVALDARLRPLLRDPRLWLAAALALAVVSPVLWWNAARGGASFRFHLAERIAGGGAVRLNPLGPIRFLLPLLLSAGPFALAAALWPRHPASGTFAALHRRLALAALAVPTALFLALSTVTTAIYYWDVVGVVLLLPAAAVAGRPRLLAAHGAMGLLAGALMTVHATALPLTVLLPGVEDDDSRMTWGFDALAAAVEAARLAHPGALVAASDYRSASSLAFALDRDDVLAIARRRSQFDEWDATAGPGRAGRDAVLVVEDREPMTPWLAGHFGAVEPLGEVEARRFGRPVKRYQLWLGRTLRRAP
jgi:4-amino-4-deoxy-L-arabinose transferase-like glycosyltransferase